MQHRRRAELLIVNLRWLELLAIAALMDEGGSRTLLAIVPLAVFLCNVIAYHICLRPISYQRFSFWPGYAARAVDLLAVTFLTAHLGASDGTVYLLYGTIIVGAGFTYGLLTALGACVASIILFSTSTLLSGEQFTPTVLSGVRLSLFPISVFAGNYLAKEFEREWNRRESYKRLEGIYQLGAAFNEKHNTDEILQKTAETALDLTNADRCFMTLYQPNSQQIDKQAELTRPGANLQSRSQSCSIVTEFQSHIQTCSKQSGVAIEVEDLGEPTARIETPLSLGSRVVGKLEVESWNPDISLGKDEARILTILGTQAAVAIQNARMMEDLQTQAETDPLTGLLNRRVLTQQVEREIGKAIDERYPVSIWIFDIDDFKGINDRYGHLVGDEVLQKVGSTLRRTTRSGDLSSRYGGDEFLVVLRNVDADDALGVVQSIKEHVESLVIDAGNNVQCTIRLSGGLSCTTVDGLDARELIRCADERLLQAKRQGKNRICSPKRHLRKGEASKRRAA